MNLSKRSGDKELFYFNFSLSKYNEFILYKDYFLLYNNKKC